MSEKTTSINEVIQIGRMAEELLDGKEFFIGTISDRLDKAASIYPHDQAIGTMRAVIGKRFAKEGSLAIISQREFQELYEEVSGLGKREAFKDELGDLLYDATTKKVAYHNDDYINQLRGDGSSLELVDAKTSLEFSDLFSLPEEGLQKSLFVENGLKGVKLELLSMGFDNPACEIAAQDSNFVIFAAEFDTLLGRTPILVPAEIKLGSVLLPSVFVSGNEFLDFTYSNIINHSRKFSGQIKSATPTAILNTLNKLSNKVVKGTAEAGDQIETTSLSSPGLYSDLVEETPSFDFSPTQVNVPKPLEGLTETFVQETLLEAGISYDRDLVVKAKVMLSNELRGMGLPHDKITIASEWQQGIIFATNITGLNGKKTIEIPVEIVNDKTILMPSTFTSGTVIKAFNETNLTAFAHAKEEGVFQAIFSDKRDMPFNELYDNALRSAAYGNFVEVEESLAVIGERFGSQFHKIAFDDLMELVRIGFNSNEAKPLNAIDDYIKKAAKEIKNKEKNVSLSNSLLYLYTEDER